VEEARLICDLRENQGKSWAYLPSLEKIPYNRQIAEQVPGRSSQTLAVNYKFIKGLIETFSREEVMP